ncbi:dehydrogenase/reductase SDR family member on chromosome X-like isoform X1 [Zingiber officinale]|uniref:dehydrogenase/reductase SDR family member on chromosome X-like isoform X1 n=1 Tax=Zingiber officinale TaxID=94328 RepID=UPI001C4D111F|nr:dehydrogenase/reductase SDR family member on chromosome X-like isoform X1 [Zingiber officinale]
MDWEAAKMMCSLQFWRMAVYWALALVYSRLYLLLLPYLSNLFPSLLRPPPPPFPRRRFSPGHQCPVRRPICVVTGATSGLGKAAARALAAEGYHVLLASRSPQALNKAVWEIKKHDPNAYVEAFQLDISSMHSIMKFECNLKQWLQDANLHPSVQLLINNAGILAKSSRVTADGFDEMIETNYLGAFFLTNILLPLLKNSPVPSRIVNVTSFTHRCVSHVDQNKGILARENFHVFSSKKYCFAQTYEYSKFCTLLFSYELHRQLYAMDSASVVSVMAADPGFVETNIMRELPPSLQKLAFMVLGFLHLLQSPEIGVGSIIDAALASPEASGKYFYGAKGRTIKSSPISYDVKLSKELWLCSYELLQECKSRIVNLSKLD